MGSGLTEKMKKAAGPRRYGHPHSAVAFVGHANSGGPAFIRDRPLLGERNRGRPSLSFAEAREKLLDLGKTILAGLCLAGQATIRALDELAALANGPLIGRALGAGAEDFQGVGICRCFGHAPYMAQRSGAFHPFIPHL